MANKLNFALTASLNHAAGTATLRVTGNRTLQGSGFVLEEQEIGTSWEPITITDISSLGFLMFQNTDETNFVQIATANDDSGIFGKVLAGRGLAVEVVAGATYYLKADTATVKVVILATEP